MVKLLRRFSKVTSSAAQLLINMLIEEYPLDENKPWSKKLHKALKVQVCNGRHGFSNQYKATDAVNINGGFKEENASKVSSFKSWQDMDSHQHLFFQCAYAEQFWKFAMSRMGVQIGQMDWKMIISHMSSLYCGNSIDSVIRRVGFAACVYLIWQERNCRIFRDEKRSIKELTDVFTEIIRMSTVSLKVKRSSAVINVQRKWNVIMNSIFLQTFSEFYVINGCLGPWIRCSWLPEDFMKSCQR
ncbi:hypothetical protein Tco_0878915 [Tanacetum coccineum]|uniref:Reverse transcriptase zinc-binding domain-containing protein n=1 Tax=Tanacetum coccineum TaxID=301880 RepID=A0ABQ5C119_9ASTR